MVVVLGHGTVLLGMARHGAVTQGLAWQGEGGLGLRVQLSNLRG
jgi:hypothetical protein